MTWRPSASCSRYSKDKRILDWFCWLHVHIPNIKLLASIKLCWGRMLLATKAHQLQVWAFSHYFSVSRLTLRSCWHIVPTRKRSSCFARQLRWVFWDQVTSGSSLAWPWATPTALHLTASLSVLLEWLQISGGRAYGKEWERESPLWRKVLRASRSSMVLFLKDTVTATNPPNTQTTTLCSGEVRFKNSSTCFLLFLPEWALMMQDRCSFHTFASMKSKYFCSSFACGLKCRLTWINYSQPSLLWMYTLRDSENHSVGTPRPPPPISNHAHP